MRLNLPDEFFTGGRQPEVEGATVGGNFRTADQVALFETVHQSGDIGAVHDELAAEFDLGAAGRQSSEQVQHIELAGAEIPAGKENPAGVPQGFGSAQQFDEGKITGPG